jgi:hypothetical protein
LAGSILVGLGFVVVVVTLLVINNLFSKYWKPFEWGLMPTYRFTDTAHELDKSKEPVIQESKVNGK